MPSLVKITETVNSSGLKVDLKRGIIRGVKILGLQSDNGRRYLPEAVKNAAKLYEGVKVNINHPKDADDPRRAEDRFGKLRNVRYVPNKGLYGDLEFLKSHPMAERICEAAERMPDAFGMSHNAQGDGEEQDGIFVVNKIVEVRHVDLVADPATTKSLSESRIKESFDFKDAVYGVAKLIQKDRLFDAHRLLVQLASKDISQQAKSLASKYSQEIKKLAYQQSKGESIDKATKDSLVSRLLNNSSQLSQDANVESKMKEATQQGYDELSTLISSLEKALKSVGVILNSQPGKKSTIYLKSVKQKLSDVISTVKNSSDLEESKEGESNMKEGAYTSEANQLLNLQKQCLTLVSKMQEIGDDLLQSQEMSGNKKNIMTVKSITMQTDKIETLLRIIANNVPDINRMQEQEEDELDDETLMDYEDGEMADESSVSSDEMEQDEEDDKNKMEQNEEDEMSEEEYQMEQEDESEMNNEDMEEEDEDMEEEEDEDDDNMYESKRRVTSRVRQLLQLCEQHQVRPTRATISDLAKMPKGVARRTIRKLGLLERASKPRSSGHTFQNRNASGPSGVDLFNWLKD